VACSGNWHHSMRASEGLGLYRVVFFGLPSHNRRNNPQQLESSLFALVDLEGAHLACSIYSNDLIVLTNLAIQ